MSNPTAYQLFTRFLCGYIKPHLFRLIIALVAMIVVSATTYIFAKSMQPIIDDVLIAKDMSMLKFLSIGLVVLFAVKAVAMYVSNFQMEWIGQRSIISVQKQLFARLIHQDLNFFQQNPPANLTSRFIFDIQRLKDCFAIVISGVTRDVTMIIGLLINLFAQDWLLACFSLFALPLIIAPVRQLGRRMRKYATHTQDSTAELTHILNESLSHNRQVKIYTNEDFQKGHTGRQIDEVFKHVIKSLKVRCMSSPIMEFLGGIITASVLVFGGTRVVDGDITAGAFMSFLTTLLLLYRPLKGLSNIHIRLQQGIAAAESIFTLLDQDIGIEDKKDAKNFDFKQGDISIKNISLTYADGSEALKNINMDIKNGTSVAFVGPSGAGKSSLLNLIPRFYESTGGSICLDEQNINDVTLKSLRESISLVSQDVALFKGTVKENIAYGRINATDEEIIEAAKLAAAHEFISDMDNGYDSDVGDLGSKLSGGQRQRIAIARAFLKNAPILLLDEATSALDTESERQIQSSLEELMKGRTTIIVAHRLSTIRHADCIYVMDKGRVKEQGTHDELMALEGIYTNLQKTQQIENEFNA